MDLYQQNYRKLVQLLPGLHDMNAPAKLTALGHNDGKRPAAPSGNWL